MDVRVGVAPPGRLETTAVVSSLRDHGLDAVVIGPGDEVDVVLVVVHDAGGAHDTVDVQVRRAIASASGRPVLALMPRGGVDSARLVTSLGVTATADPSTATATLVETLAHLARGGSAALPRQRSASVRPTLDQLTQRQNEIVDLMVQGFRNEEIGDRLGISTHTVRTHVQHILNRLDVQHRHGLASLVRASHGREQQPAGTSRRAAS